MTFQDQLLLDVVDRLSELVACAAELGIANQVDALLSDARRALLAGDATEFGRLLLVARDQVDKAHEWRTDFASRRGRPLS